MYGNDENTGDKGSFESYRTEGDMLYKLGNSRKAIQSFTKALEFRNDDRHCLVARSKCHLQLGDTAKALKDADASLKEDKTYHTGLCQKAEVLYSMGDFEMALVYYHRGHKIRPELEVFRLGIQKAIEAIDNCVGCPQDVTLTTEGDLSYFTKIQKKSAYELSARSKPKSAALKSLTLSPSLSGSEQSKFVGTERTIKSLLGELYGDKVFLETVLKDTESSASRSLDFILGLVGETLDYLQARADFWRQQKPMYARQRERNEQRVRHSTPLSNPQQYLMNEYKQIHKLQTQSKYGDSVLKAKKALKTIEGWPGDVDNLDEARGNLNSYIGTGYLEMNDHKNALMHHLKDYELVQAAHRNDLKSRALDNLGRVYARSGQYQRAIDVWMDKIPLVESSLEESWLYHEIGRCHLELGNNQEALTFGQRSMRAAGEARDNVWRLNACVLMAQAQVKLAKLLKALELFSQARDLAKMTFDYDAEKAIKKATSEIDKQLQNLLMAAPPSSPPGEPTPEKTTSGHSDVMFATGN